MKGVPPGLTEDDSRGRFYDGRLMRRLLTYLRPYWRHVGGAGLLLVVLSVLQVLGPLLTTLAVDRYLVPRSLGEGGMAPTVAAPATYFEGWFPSERWAGIAAVSIAYLIVLLLIAICDFAQSYLMQHAGQLAMSDLRKQLMARLQSLDIAYFDGNPVGRVVTRVTTDVDALNELFTAGLIAILGDLLMLAVMLVAMFRLSPELTGVILVVMPLVVVVTVRFRRAASESYRRIRVAIARINAYLAEHINGMTVVQLFNREAACTDAFDRINEDHRDACKEALFVHSWFNPVVEFASMLAIAGLLAYGGVVTGTGALTLGVLVAFFQYALRFFRPMQELSDRYSVLQSAVAASEKIFALLDTGASIQRPRAPKTIPRIACAIEFDHVWFAYAHEEWVLRDVSFTIRAGETVAVVGHTGAGKSTVINLMLRFYDIQRGSIRVGGVDIRELDPLELRRLFGVVLQEPHLFAGTIADNIRLSTEGITDEQVFESAERVNLRDFVDSLPGGFAEPVQERGHGLSTGQKQLIGFARALAHDPPCLILDEATSSVDTDTEHRVRAGMVAILEGRTAIVIAHRLSTVEGADRILVMHKGRLREEGTHRELLAQRGIYWTLHRFHHIDEDVSFAGTAALVGRQAQGVV